MRSYAPAKINLCLHVGPVRNDGRHPLESLVAFAGPEASDQLSARLSNSDEINISGPFAEDVGPQSDNLVLKAWRRLRGQVRLPGDGPHHVSFELAKHLPVAAGIGGGSADAAAALRLLAGQLYDLPDRVTTDIAPQIGGDVLACVHSRPLIMRGDGDHVDVLDTLAWDQCFDSRYGGGLPAVLVNPGLACPTGPVFRHFDSIDGGRRLDPLCLPETTSPFELMDWLMQTTRNDLEEAAIECVPEIGYVLEVLRDQNRTQLARMSGSGATCFALFPTLDEAFLTQTHLARTYPNWWVRATRLGVGA